MDISIGITTDNKEQVRQIAYEEFGITLGDLSDEWWADFFAGAITEYFLKTGIGV